jgi:hypothetical protein
LNPLPTFKEKVNTDICIQKYYSYHKIRKHRQYYFVQELSQ